MNVAGTEQGGRGKSALVLPSIMVSAVQGNQALGLLGNVAGTGQGGWSQNALVSPSITVSVVQGNQGPGAGERRWRRTGMLEHKCVSFP